MILETPFVPHPSQGITGIFSIRESRDVETVHIISLLQCLEKI